MVRLPPELWGRDSLAGSVVAFFPSVLLEPDEEANPISAVVEIKPNTKYDVTYRVDPAQTTHGQVADTAAPNDHRKKGAPWAKADSQHRCITSCVLRAISGHAEFSFPERTWSVKARNIRLSCAVGSL